VHCLHSQLITSHCKKDMSTLKNCKLQTHKVWQSFCKSHVKAVISLLYTLTAPVTFKAISLHSNKLNQAVFSCFKKVLEPLFWNSIQNRCHMSLNNGSVWKSVTLQSGFEFENNQKSHRGKAGEHDGWSNCNINFLTRNSQTKACHEWINCHDSRCKQQAEV